MAPKLTFFGGWWVVPGGGGLRRHTREFFVRNFMPEKIFRHPMIKPRFILDGNSEHVAH